MTKCMAMKCPRDKMDGDEVSPRDEMDGTEVYHRQNGSNETAATKSPAPGLEAP